MQAGWPARSRVWSLSHVARGREAIGGLEGHIVVLIDAITADSQTADELAGAAAGDLGVDRRAAGEEHDAVLVGDVERGTEVRLRIERVEPLHALERGG